MLDRFESFKLLQLPRESMLVPDVDFKPDKPRVYDPGEG
jgi:hypothetical protein